MPAAGIDRDAQGAGNGRRPVLEMRRIDKRYPGVEALRAVDFDVAPGEVHGLVGENGAGKSTLIRILSGATHADAGEVCIAGEPVVRPDIEEPPKTPGRRASVPTSGPKDRPEGGLRPEPQPGA